ncbi:hypothetical protein BDZ88DRAFT_456584 [Geranomyces variabilis]|nr:hypothetical protein BDZ88DRAFT_456584 [Geranomyces variabilis]KAJ3131029.1 hypothetical protein HDU90_009199 [Geranomyces variabilis]
MLDHTNLVAPLITNTLRANGDNVSVEGFASGDFKKISNSHGELKVNNITLDAPLEVNLVDGVADIVLEINETHLSIDSNGLNGIPDTREFPLQYDEATKTETLVSSAPLGVVEGDGLCLAFDDSLRLNENNELSVVPNRQQLEAVAPVSIDINNKVNLDVDSTLSVIDGKLHVIEEMLVAPIKRDANGAILLDFGKGLDEKDGVLVTNIDDVVKPLGALHTGNILDIGLNEALDYGFNSLSELTGDVPDTEMTMLKLKASDDFSQKTGTLTIKSAGSGRIPYYGVFDGFNTRDTLQFNDTLSTLSVPHVSLNQNFNPDSNEAVTQSYISQYIQSGAAIEMAAKANNKRLLNIRTDASLQVDGNNNLGVNVSPLVDGKTTRMVDGKISNGLTFQPTFGLALENQNMVKLKPTVAGAITFTNDNTIGESLTASSGVKRVDNDFKLDLRSSNAGNLVDNEAGRITLDLVGSNKISTDLVPYTAGENVTITNNNISATVPEGKTYTAGPGLSLIGNEFVNSLNITAGLGIIVMGSAETGYIISSESLKSKRTDDDEDQKTDNNTDETLDATNNNPEVVEATGAIASLVPLALTPLASLSAIGAAPAAIGGGLYGLLGGLAGAAGAGSLFGTVWGYERDRRTKKNPDGTVQTDANGNPVYDLDGNGNYQFDPQDATNIAIIEDKTTRKSRLLFDSIHLPTYNEQAMNYGMTWQFETDITRPWAVDTMNG